MLTVHPSWPSVYVLVGSTEKLHLRGIKHFLEGLVPPMLLAIWVAGRVHQVAVECAEDLAFTPRGILPELAEVDNCVRIYF